MMVLDKIFSSYSVRDVPTVRAFYETTLGLKVSEEDGMLHLHVTSNYEVLLYPKGEAHSPASFTVLNFLVPDVDAAVDELAAKGIRFEQYPELHTDEKGISREEMVQVAWFKDPDGNILSVLQA